MEGLMFEDFCHLGTENQIVPWYKASFIPVSVPPAFHVPESLSGLSELLSFCDYCLLFCSFVPTLQ